MIGKSLRGYGPVLLLVLIGLSVTGVAWYGLNADRAMRLRLLAQNCAVARAKPYATGVLTLDTCVRDDGALISAPNL